ncbi:MAG: hypothetical protein HYW71_03085 [Candidatus Niyogibacteria bacterium]|nr:hypothetical protein [Candidatus Niyogibacteria bacterium]
MFQTQGSWRSTIRSLRAFSFLCRRISASKQKIFSLTLYIFVSSNCLTKRIEADTEFNLKENLTSKEKFHGKLHFLINLLDFSYIPRKYFKNLINKNKIIKTERR